MSFGCLMVQAVKPEKSAESVKATVPLSLEL